MAWGRPPARLILLLALVAALPTALSGAPGSQLGEASPDGTPLALPDDVEAAAVLLEAEDSRVLSEDLAVLSHHRDGAVRGRAALALGRTGLPGAAPRLLELAGDPVAGVRELAAFGLGHIDTALAGGAGPALRQRIVDGLAALIEDPVAGVAAQAAWALGVQAVTDASARGTGGEGGPALPGDGIDAAAVAARESLVAVLAPGTEARAEVVVQALGAWSRLPEAAIARSVRWLGDPDAEVRLAAALAVGRSRDPNTLPALIPLLDDADPRVRAAAARGLRALPWTVARPRALRLLEDRDWRVVAAGLAWVGAAWRERQSGDEITEEALAAVLRATLRRDPHARVGGLVALGAVVTDWPVAMDRLLEAIDDEDPAVRLASLEALAASPELPEAVLERVCGHHGLDVPPPERPGPAAEAAERFGDRPLETAALVRLLGRTGDDVARRWVLLLAEHGPVPARLAALETWAAIEPRRAAAAAAALLQGGPPVLQAAAARQVARLHGRGQLGAGGGRRGSAGRQGSGPPPWEDLLWSAQRRLEGAGREGLRLAVLEALHDVAPELLRLRASLLFDDTSRTVRRWALAQRFSEPAPPLLDRVSAPDDGSRTRDDYRALARRVLQLQEKGGGPRLEVSGERGAFVVELSVRRAPRTVVNLLDAAQAGLLERMVAHRVTRDLALHTGDPTATGLGVVGSTWPTEETPGAFTATTVGQLLTAPGLGGSRLFLARGPRPDLDGLRARIGVVIEGQRAADRIQRGDVLDVRVAS